MPCHQTRNRKRLDANVGTLSVRGGVILPFPKIDQQACKDRVLHSLCEGCSSFHNAYHNRIDHRHRVFPKRHLHKLTLTYHIPFAESEHQVEEKKGRFGKKKINRYITCHQPTVLVPIFLCPPANREFRHAALPFELPFVIVTRSPLLSSLL